MAIIDQYEEWVDHQARLAALDEAERAHRERVAALLGPYQADLSTFRERVRAALLAGEPPPPAPEPPDLGGDMDGPTVFSAERQALADAGIALRARLAPEIELAAAAREGELREQAAAVLAQLEPLVAEWRELLGEVREARYAAESVAPERIIPSGSSRTRATVSAADVLDAAAGVSLLEPEPAPTRAEGRIEIDTDVPAFGGPQHARRLGLDRPKPFGEPPIWDPPAPLRRVGEI